MAFLTPTPKDTEPKPTKQVDCKYILRRIQLLTKSGAAIKGMLVSPDAIITGIVGVDIIRDSNFPYYLINVIYSRPVLESTDKENVAVGPAMMQYEGCKIMDSVMEFVA